MQENAGRRQVEYRKDAGKILENAGKFRKEAGKMQGGCRKNTGWKQEKCRTKFTGIPLYLQLPDLYFLVSFLSFPFSHLGFLS